jgi:hypothetical protein
MGPEVARRALLASAGGNRRCRRRWGPLLRRLCCRAAGAGPAPILMRVGFPDAGRSAPALLQDGQTGVAGSLDGAVSRVGAMQRPTRDGVPDFPLERTPAPRCDDVDDDDQARRRRVVHVQSTRFGPYLNRSVTSRHHCREVTRTSARAKRAVAPHGSLGSWLQTRASCRRPASSRTSTFRFRNTIGHTGDNSDCCVTHNSNTQDLDLGHEVTTGGCTAT